MEYLQQLISEQFPYLSYLQVKILIDNLYGICQARNIDISSLNNIGSGESSIVFELGNEVIKITFNEYDRHPSMKEYVSHSSAILQPNFEIIIDQVKLHDYSAKIIGLKKLLLDGISTEDVLSVYMQLRKDGYLWYDTKAENIGRDENGNLFLIDYGELIYINDLDPYHRNKEEQAHCNRKPELDKYYLDNQDIEFDLDVLLK